MCEIGQTHLVLLDNYGKKQNQLKGRTDSNKAVIIDNIDQKFKIGQYLEVKIEKASLKTLFGRVIKESSLNNKM